MYDAIKAYLKSIETLPEAEYYKKARSYVEVYFPNTEMTDIQVCRLLSSIKYS